MSGSTHDLGDVTVEALAKESKLAMQELHTGLKCLVENELAEAMNAFFKSAAISVNVLFTARTHNIPISGELTNKMEKICGHATHGIKKVLKLICFKRILKHEEIHHDLENPEVKGLS